MTSSRRGETGEKYGARSAGPRFAPGPADGAFAIGVLAAITPIVVAASRAAARGWVPVGDDAYTAIRGHDVFGGHVPLLGTWSSATLWAHRQISHPGPVQFDVAAIPIRLFGSGTGVVFSTAGVNVAAVVTAALLARRLIGPIGATMVMLFTAGLLWAMGSELLFDPWSQYAPVLPFLAFLFAVWSVASGRVGAWPVLVIAGSYVLQTHLSYAVVVPGLSGWAVVAWLLGLRRLRRQRRSEPEQWTELRRRQLKWAAIGVACVAVLWAQPVYQQLTGDVGNMSELARSVVEKGPPTPGPRGALQFVGTVVGVPPFWFPPTWARPRAGYGTIPRSLWLLAGALAVVVGMGAVLCWLARRGGDRTSVSGLVTAGLAVALAFSSILNAKTSFGLITASYVRWLWPISMFVWTVLVIAAVRAVQRTGRFELPRPRPVVVGEALAALTMFVAVLTLPTVDHGAAAPRWAMRDTVALSRQALPRLRSRGPVLVRMQSATAFSIGPGLLSALQRHGIDFVVDDKDLVSQLGEDRRFDGTNARTLVLVVGGETAETAPAGYQRIAYVSPLTPAERRLRRQLGAQVKALLAGLHRLPLNGSALGRLPLRYRVAIEATASHPSQLDAADLSSLLSQHLIDDRTFGRVAVRRWLDLTRQWLDRTTALLARPLPEQARP